MIAAVAARAADPAPSGPASGDVLLLDSVGRAVPTPVHSLHESLRPRSETERAYQTPTPQKGVPFPLEELRALQR